MSEPAVDTETLSALAAVLDSVAKLLSGPTDTDRWRTEALAERAEREVIDMLAISKVGLANALNLPVP